MSALLESLLTPGQRAQACEADKPLRRAVDRVDPPPVVSRADQIVAEGDAKRVAYGRANPYADSAMVYGAQIAHLHGMVRKLCAELEQYSVTRTAGLDYCEVEASVGTVVVGYGYQAEIPDRITSARTLELTGDPGHPGSAARVDIAEVWLNGVDVFAWVPDAELDRIADYVLERHEIKVRAKRERDKALADERGAA